ncbi:MAG: 1-acyl-sn-glycerol-3-phosphate acyltransferase [Candidatus Omnitrophica bacterium]|nr:1-acyl-sn-glycerol-3-phosphate acyltransferase [Candidatus Omnitrophota bacterium]
MEDSQLALKFWDKFSLHLQRIIGWLTFPIWGGICILLLRLVGRYRIERIREIRRRFKEIQRVTRGPIIICANHITKIDSALINWGLASVLSYMKSFRFFSWNLPERERYKNNPVLRLVCYLGSCIPVDRGGDRDGVQKALDKLTYLLRKGHAITIFPEGKRSVDGKVDDETFSYSVGRLLKSVRDCKILCVYLRGHKQNKSSGIPKIGDRIYFDMEVIEPESDFSGLRETRDLAAQIIQQLARMEQAYFATSR